MSGGHFYLRVEHEDWDFLRSLGRPLPFDAAIVDAAYLAPYPKGHPRDGEQADRLTEALRDLDVPWALHPDTAELFHRWAKSGELRSRALATTFAQRLRLPLTRATLGLAENRLALVGACQEMQDGAAAVTAPFIEVDGPDDVAIALDRLLVEQTAEVAADRPVLAFAQVRVPQLRDGTAARLGRELVAGGARLVFVRIRRFVAEDASANDVLAYAGVVDSIREGGARAVADCSGRLGPVLVAAGAHGFATGPLRFRKVRDTLAVKRGSGGGGPPLMIEVEARFGSVARGDTHGDLCKVAGCSTSDERGIRIHNLHTLHELGRLAAAEGLAFAARLRTSGSPVALGWADALDQLGRARRAA